MRKSAGDSPSIQRKSVFAQSLSANGSRLCRIPAAGRSGEPNAPEIRIVLRLVEDDIAALRDFQARSEDELPSPAGTRPQALADEFSLDQLKRDLNGLVRQCVPGLLERFRGGYHWTLMQLEYSFDLVRRSAA